MEQTVLDELLRDVTSLFTWESSLDFVDIRFPDGVVDLCQYLNNNQSTTNISPNAINFPTNCHYFFDESCYGDGVGKLNSLNWAFAKRQRSNVTRSIPFRILSFGGEGARDPKVPSSTIGLRSQINKWEKHPAFKKFAVVFALTRQIHQYGDAPPD